MRDRLCFSSGSTDNSKRPWRGPADTSGGEVNASLSLGAPEAEHPPLEMKDATRERLQSHWTLIVVAIILALITLTVAWLLQ
jgi:hypothetical protein